MNKKQQDKVKKMDKGDIATLIFFMIIFLSWMLDLPSILSKLMMDLLNEEYLATVVLVVGRGVLFALTIFIGAVLVSEDSEIIGEIK